MPFAPTTLKTLVPMLSIPVTAANVKVVADILTGIEAINGGLFVSEIETLISQILAIKATALSPASLAQSGMIKADVVEWQRGAGAGAGIVAQYKLLMNNLYSLLGLSNPSNTGVSMHRSDRYSLTGGSRSIIDDWRFISW